MLSRTHTDVVPEMSRARWELDARIDHAFAKAREAQLKADELDRRAAHSTPPTDEEVERIREFVLGHARTSQWERVVELIDRGESTWRQVVEGLVSGRLDRRVAEAFDSLSTVPPATEEELTRLGAPAHDEPSAQDARTRRREVVDEDEFFDDPLSWRRG